MGLGDSSVSEEFVGQVQGPRLNIQNLHRNAIYIGRSVIPMLVEGNGWIPGANKSVSLTHLHGEFQDQENGRCQRNKTRGGSIASTHTCAYVYVCQHTKVHPHT